MSKRVRETVNSGSYKETEEYKRHERLMEKIRCMSIDEKLQTLVDAGIINEQGELTQRYGGSAPNCDD